MNLKGKKRAYQISTIILLIAITLICILGRYIKQEREHKRYVEEFNQEFQTGYQLLYGEWETTEFLGGGMVGYSLGNERRELMKDERERIAICPDHIIVNGKKEYGNVYILYKTIPEKWIYDVIQPWKLTDDAEIELKNGTQDFYLIAAIIFDGNHPTGNVFLDNYIFVKNSDTIIIASMFGFFKAERVGILEDDEILEAEERSIKRQLEQGDDYMDVQYRYQLRRYQVVYGEWRIEDYIAYEDMEQDGEGTGQIGKIIEFSRDYIKVNGEVAKGDVYVLYNLIPENIVEETQEICKEKEGGFKEGTVDFYTVAKILTRPDNTAMQELRNKIPGEGYQIYVKNSDTLVMKGRYGYFVLGRIGYIDGVAEEELVDYTGGI